jgi:hypothetical protein
MLASGWLAARLSAKMSTKRSPRSAQRRTTRRARPRIEVLESRVVLDFAPDSFLKTPFASHNDPGHPLVEHFHPHLRIFIDGTEHVIPGDTNIVFPGNPAGDDAIRRGIPQGLYPIHVHKEDLPGDPGKLHVEAPLPSGFTSPPDFHLKDFFTIWTFTSGSDKILSSQEIKMMDSNGQNIDFRADATHTITMTVDGQSNSDFENFVLTDPHQPGDDPGPDIRITGTTNMPPPTMGANQTFVSHCYSDFLGRQADSGGMSHFSGLMDQGTMNRAQVAQAIETSLECRTKQVEDMYHKYLGRIADPIGLNASIAWLGTNHSMEELRETIVRSPEYFQHHNNSNSDFVTALYQDGLGRPLDPVGQGGAIPALNFGFSRAQLVKMVMTSPEGAQAVAQSYYNLLLHRRADDGGLAQTAADVQRGVSEDQIQVRIAASDEYFNRH